MCDCTKSAFLAVRETGRGGRERERVHGLTAVSTEGERGPRNPDGLQEVTGRDRACAGSADPRPDS